MGTGQTRGQVIRSQRQLLGMTQIQLAEAVGLHQSTISSLEQGKHEAPISTLERVADALRLPVSALLSV